MDGSATQRKQAKPNSKEQTQDKQLKYIPKRHLPAT
jgi:hypothetical protein